jgi:hypothetical protein
VAAGGLTLLLTALPEILIVAPKIGTAIYNLLHANREELPEDTLKRLDDVKLRQAAEEAEWAAGLPADDPAPEASELAKAREAEIARLRDENQKLADRLAAEQAAIPPAATGEPEDAANGGPNVDSFNPDLFADGSSRDSIKHLGEHGENLPPPPEPAGP